MRSSDFVITDMITDRISLHSVLLCTIFFKIIVIINTQIFLIIAIF